MADQTGEHMRKLIVVLIAIACLSSRIAAACSFDGFPIPDSIVDKLMASNQIVLARPDPGEEFRFKIIASLEGDHGASTVPQTLSSIERDRMISHPDDAVLFARRGYFGNWRRIGYIPARHRDLFERIANRLPDWRQGKDHDRAAFFTRHAADPDPLVRTNALIELGRQQYAVLRSLEHSTSADPLLERLAVLSEHYLVPIRLQLIGLSGDRSALSTMKGLLATAVQTNDQNLRHHAVAFIELGGAGALHELSTVYLSDSDVPPDARQSVMDAIALHLREGDPRLRFMLQWVVQQERYNSADFRPASSRRLPEDLQRTFVKPAATLTGLNRG